MKRSLPLLALLVLPHLAFAQPAAPAPPAAGEQAPPKAPDLQAFARMMKAMAFAFNQDNGAAVATMGAFYNSIQKATSYNGHWVMTQQDVKEGKATGTSSMDVDAVWQKDAQTGVVKSRTNIVSTTTTEDGKTTTTKLLAINDGQKQYRYYPERNVWMEEPQKDKGEFNYAQVGPWVAWSTTLLRTSMNSNFKIQKSPDGAAVTSTEDGSYGATFNADGTLQSWRAGGAGKSSGELHFRHLELNTPVSADSFVWKVPQGAQQVPPEEAKNSFNFNFGFDDGAFGDK